MNDSFSALADAVRANDTAVAGDLLRQHPDLSAKLNDPMPGGDFGGKLMLKAAEEQNREMIELLLRHGADINTRSDWWAGSFGVLDSCALEFAWYLIAHGATVDAHAAARLGMMAELTEIVTANPAVVYARGGDGQTPLHFASTVEIATFLLEHGADRDALDVDHESTPAQWMVGDRQDVARLLVTRGCRTDILMAAALGSVELVRRHLDDNPASIRTRVSPEYFPMRNRHAGGSIYIWTLGKNKSAHMIAHEFGHTEVFQLLMERGPETLTLVDACLLGDETLVNALLAKRPDVVQSMSQGERRAIADAAGSNNAAAVRLMLRAGWPVDARGDLGGTPLHYAAWMGNVEMVRDLLQRGAPLEDRGDTYKLTPLGWAFHGSLNSWRKTSGDYVATVRALLDAGAVAPKSVSDINASAAVLASLSS
ncbi:MAG: ankyrin repeat domain-containing protein [bacterium]